MALTALRTAATTAVATKYLARRDSRTALLCGCGAQAEAQLRAVTKVRLLSHIGVYDLDAEKAETFAAAIARELNIPTQVVMRLADGVAGSDIVITCTSARRFFIERDMVRPGTFVAGIGADNEHKQELDPRLLAQSTVVADSIAQCCAIGDLHHAVAANLLAPEAVHAELGDVVAGRKRARATPEETIVFDSCGVALGDVAAAVAVYRRATQAGDAARFAFDV
jgi:ornithine cyclodeaminase/alanine dehydrogenase-like protein (mu-crystallin family)